jgi:hypothetical protein
VQIKQGEIKDGKTYLIPLLLTHTLQICPLTEPRPPLPSHQPPCHPFLKTSTHRIRKNNIQPPQPLHRLPHSPSRIASHRHIRLDNHTLDSMFLARGRNLFGGTVAIEVVDGDVAPVRGKGRGEEGAETPGLEECKHFGNM